MGADAYWRIDTDAVDEATLTAAADALVTHPWTEVSAQVDTERQVFWGRASFEEGPTEQMDALVEALLAIVGGTSRRSDDFGASGPAFDTPGTGEDLRGFALAAPLSEPGPPSDAEAAADNWRAGAKSRGAWSDLADRIKPYVGKLPVDNALLHSLLNASAYDDAGKHAVYLLTEHPDPRITAAFVEVARKHRGGGFHGPRLDALHALLHRAPDVATAAVLLEIGADPSLSTCPRMAVDLAMDGQLEVDMLWPLFSSKRPQSDLVGASMWDTMSPEGIDMFWRATAHPEPAFAAFAAAVVFRFDIDLGLDALQRIDLTVLDGLYLRRIPKNHALAEARDWGHQLGRRNPSPDAIEQVTAAINAAATSRGVTSNAPPPWEPHPPRPPSPDALAQADAAERALLDAHRDWLDGHRGPGAAPHRTERARVAREARKARRAEREARRAARKDRTGGDIVAEMKARLAAIQAGRPPEPAASESTPATPGSVTLVLPDISVTRDDDGEIGFACRIPAELAGEGAVRRVHSTMVVRDDSGAVVALGDHVHDRVLQPGEIARLRPRAFGRAPIDTADCSLRFELFAGPRVVLYEGPVAQGERQSGQAEGPFGTTVSGWSIAVGKHRRRDQLEVVAIAELLGSSVVPMAWLQLEILRDGVVDTDGTSREAPLLPGQPALHEVSTRPDSVEGITVRLSLLVVQSVATVETVVRAG